METQNESNISKIAKSNNFLEFGNTYWKEVDDYPLTMIVKKKVVFVEICIGVGKKAIPAKVRKHIKSMSKRTGVKKCKIYDGSIILSFSNMSLKSHDLEDITNKIIESLKNNAVPGIVDCQICKNTLKDTEVAYIKVNESHIKVHKECYSTLVEDVERNKKNNGNYVFGILGAIVFGALGSIPRIIVGHMGWFASILSLVIGLSANFGYNLFKGRQGKVKMVTLIFVIITMVIIAGYIAQMRSYFMYFHEEEINAELLLDGLQSLNSVLKVDVGFRSMFVRNLLIGIGFGVLGSWRGIKSSLTPKNNKQKTVEVINVK